MLISIETLPYKVDKLPENLECTIYSQVEHHAQRHQARQQGKFLQLFNSYPSLLLDQRSSTKWEIVREQMRDDANYQLDLLPKKLAQHQKN
jgi:hypothetical protein